MREMIDAYAESLVPVVRESVARGSIVHSDGCAGYLPSEKTDYQHEATILRGKKKTASN